MQHILVRREGCASLSILKFAAYSTSDVVLKARPWPRGSLKPNFNGLGLGTYSTGLGLKGPGLGLENCSDNFLESLSSPSYKL